MRHPLVDRTGPRRIGIRGPDQAPHPQQNSHRANPRPPRVAAAQMPRSNAVNTGHLDEIPDLFGRRSPATTAIYASVDVAAFAGGRTAVAAGDVVTGSGTALVEDYIGLRRGLGDRSVGPDRALRDVSGCLDRAGHHGPIPMAISVIGRHRHRGRSLQSSPGG